VAFQPHAEHRYICRGHPGDPRGLAKGNRLVTAEFLPGFNPQCLDILIGHVIGQLVAFHGLGLFDLGQFLLQITIIQNLDFRLPDSIPVHTRSQAGITETHIPPLQRGDELGFACRVKQRLRSGIGFVPEDRSTDGVVASFTIAENLVLDLYDTAPFAKGISMSPAKVTANAEQRTEEFDVRYTSVHDPISTLSGGNAQKVVLAREMSRPLKLLVASQPTRGLDVGSIEFVHKRIVSERDQGTPVIIVSTELDEVLNLADRIAVMYRGRIVGILDVQEEAAAGGVSRDMLGLMMAGVPLDEAQSQAEENPTIMHEAEADE